VIVDYIIEYSANAGSTWFQFFDGVGTTTTETVTGLTNGIEYQFRVSAINTVGVSDPSNIATAIPTPPPRILKQNAQDELNALDVTDKKDQKRINKADKAIGKSLQDKFWIDDSTLTKKGKKVFDHEKKAVKELLKVKSVDVSSIIEKLVDADKTLAQTAIDLVPTDTGINKVDKELVKANKEMTKAQNALDNDKPKKAIEKFKKAWNHAQKAIKHLT